MNLYIVYYGEPGQPPVVIPIACETNLVALWNTIADSDKEHLYVKDSDGKAIARFKNSLIRAIVDEGERVYGTNVVQRETKRRFDRENPDLKVVK